MGFISAQGDLESVEKLTLCIYSGAGDQLQPACRVEHSRPGHAAGDVAANSLTVDTCNDGCVGCDAINGLAPTTWEMDRDLGTRCLEKGRLCPCLSLCCTSLPFLVG